MATDSTAVAADDVYDVDDGETDDNADDDATIMGVCRKKSLEKNSMPRR